MLGYRGKWLVRVVGKSSDWPQRVVITGATAGAGSIPGVVGASQVVDGDAWSLTVEHDDGSGWSENVAVLGAPLVRNGADLSQRVSSKDQNWTGDTEPNDLVLEVKKLGPMFDVVTRPYAVDAPTLMMLADGVFVGVQGMQYMGVEIRNTWGDRFKGVCLDVSHMGRATLSSFGIEVIDAWTPSALMATQQRLGPQGLRVPDIDVGETATIYFQVDASGARRGKPDVEFVMVDMSGMPDPSNGMRFNRRTAFVADLRYDPSTGAAICRTPEATLTLQLQSIAIDAEAVTKLCRKARSLVKDDDDWRERAKRLCEEAGKGEYGHDMMRELSDLLCRCLDDDGRGWPRACVPGGMWLPISFDYTVETRNGFPGQYGPLAFNDPWWKVVLLIIAAIAWLVGLIATIVADATGWGNVGDNPRKIGTVGAFDRTTTDACIIELDGSRPQQQSVVDAITGEPNSTPIVFLDTVIPIDPQIALPVLTSTAVVGQLVYKSGARTGLTHGIITSIGPFTQTRGEDGVPDPNHPDLTLPNQFMIAPDPAFGEDVFDDRGDSGSIVLSRNPATMNQVVGLVHSGSGGTSPIQDVLAALGLTLR